MGGIAFAPADGTDKEHTCAHIQARIDANRFAVTTIGSEGSRITTADGASIIMQKDFASTQDGRF